jgi:hypothetical protein
VSEELRSLSFLAAQGRFEEFLIRLELFAEFYGICVCEWQEEKKLPAYKILYECLYWYANDYADMAPLQELRYLQKPEESSVYQGMLMWDLEEETYLYRYGTIITDRERNLFEWLKGLSVEEINSWAQKLAEEVRKLVEEMGTASGKRILLQYPVGYEKLIYALMKRLREHGVEVIPEIAGKGILFSLFEINFAESKLWDKALAKRCREIRQTIAEKAERESLFGIIKVVLKEDKKEILKPHVV